MAARYRVTIRRTGKTEKASYATLGDALDALEARARELASEVRPRTVRGLGRDYEPVRQVSVRAEVRGPRGLAGGIDVRGDGSVEAFTGRFVRRLVPLGDDEDAYSALRRVIGG